MASAKCRIGIVGYGSLGVHLAQFVLSEQGVALGLELAFVWNRTADVVTKDPSVANVALTDLADAPKRGATLVVEVCHPAVVMAQLASWLSHADVMVGSPTAFADDATLATMRRVTASEGRRCFIPSGAFWGSSDILKMSQLGSLTRLRVTMKKHPSALQKLQAPLKDRLTTALEEEVTAPFTVFEGSVRELAPLAPYNVNTMACAALAAYETLGFDKTEAVLVSDPSLNVHVVEIYAEGRGGFNVHTVRTNPAAPGAVTGNATYLSFSSSLKVAAAGLGLSAGLHFC